MKDILCNNINQDHSLRPHGLRLVIQQRQLFILNKTWFAALCLLLISVDLKSADLNTGNVEKDLCLYDCNPKMLKEIMVTLIPQQEGGSNKLFYSLI